MRIATRLSGGPTSARHARQFVGRALDQAPFDHVDDVVVLLANELVTNAILHADTDIDLVLEMAQGRVRIEVGDGSAQQPLRHRALEEATSGRGLELVEALSSDWGVQLVPGDGKRVWCEVPA